MVLSPVVSGCLPSCGGWVLVGVAAFLGSEVVLSPVVSGCLPSCGVWVLVGVAASRTKTFRNQNHRFQSKFAYCKLFGVYAGVIFHYHYHIKVYRRVSSIPFHSISFSNICYSYSVLNSYSYHTICFLSSFFVMFSLRFEYISMFIISYS